MANPDIRNPINFIDLKALNNLNTFYILANLKILFALSPYERLP